MSIFNENTTNIAENREGVTKFENNGLFENSQYRQFQASILSVVEGAGEGGVAKTDLAEIQMPGKNELISKQIAQSAIEELAGWSLIAVDERTGIVRNIPDDE